MLRGLEVLVVDLQDVGVRIYLPEIVPPGSTFAKQVRAVIIVVAPMVVAALLGVSSRKLAVVSWVSGSMVAGLAGTQQPICSGRGLLAS